MALLIICGVFGPTILTLACKTSNGMIPQQLATIHWRRVSSTRAASTRTYLRFKYKYKYQYLGCKRSAWKPQSTGIHRTGSNRNQPLNLRNQLPENRNQSPYNNTNNWSYKVITRTTNAHVTFRDSTLNTANLCPAISVVGLFYLLTVIMNFVCWFIFRCRRFRFCMCA